MRKSRKKKTPILRAWDRMEKWEKPKFKHDCQQCVSLGRYENHDLYFCRKSAGLPTVIARYGNEGSEYTSEMFYADRVVNPVLMEAQRRSMLIPLFDAAQPILNQIAKDMKTEEEILRQPPARGKTRVFYKDAFDRIADQESRAHKKAMEDRKKADLVFTIKLDQESLQRSVKQVMGLKLEIELTILLLRDMEKQIDRVTRKVADRVREMAVRRKAGKRNGR